MGDPRKQRRKYSRPKHPWRAERITEENELQKKHGLKNKREIWRAKSEVGQFRQQARILLASPGEESNKEAKEILTKLNRLGVMDSQNLEDVLALTVEDLLDRRLQTIVYKKGLAKTPKEARQLIVHKHLLVGKNVVDVPRYLVPVDEEDKIRVKIELKEAEPKPKPAEKKEEAAEPTEEGEKPKEEKPPKENKETAAEKKTKTPEKEDATEKQAESGKEDADDVKE